MTTTAPARPLQGKCALVTGSVRGLGLATARHLALCGSHVVLTGFSPDDDVERLRASIEAEHGVRAIYSAADLRRPSEIEQLIAAANSAFGGVDILVNNAAVRHSAPVEEFATEWWDEAMAVNITAAFHTTRLVIPAMKGRRWGRIVNLSSILGQRGAVNRVGYVTSKTALLGLTRAVALETVKHGITCNAVCPGTTESAVHDKAIDQLAASRQVARAEAERLFFQGKQPTGRFIPANRVAALIGFLCGDEAANITGAALPLDDGWSAG
jgi:3-hydroxybutyrate dehydrogenase